MTLPAMPWRIYLVVGLAGFVGGAIFGLVRGLHYPSTLLFAVIEGAFLFGIPAALLGLVLAGVWWLGAFVRRHTA